ncbi:hypothetical protein A9G34_08050 [Gilliamella sp. Choc4-2]|uniref:type IV pilus modification PilV family protein n=1 Tax=unclassified Gilliamella TaxID=2685620 RepID=UPI0004DD8361|nr:prepilin-type N-terminal cleavage/methylation domain-containing protein [Gilliamella apicola]KFA59626.1 hypothetical protein GAPWKB11_0369 [Gilliamella apicola]OCG33396.1 hypothetical protein A9G33_01100 [Gilliamella apicola]OCG43548.1 hypothetical protein A9G34_08050 [Gilliamella apicola]OCG53571.1 hypothetical protein A9G36_01955 [Gilliamella apicola]OCG63726.1 hypothetical protein A9G48_05145 [Gilliamella apicola]
MNNQKDAGLSLIEIMIASLLFAIVLLGLTKYQQIMLKKYHFFTNRLQAAQIAFQLLDSYPQTADYLVPSDWQYNIKITPYNNQCKLIIVKITTPYKKQTQQQRLICN